MDPSLVGVLRGFGGYLSSFREKEESIVDPSSPPTCPSTVTEELARSIGR